MITSDPPVALFGPFVAASHSAVRTAVRPSGTAGGTTPPAPPVALFGPFVAASHSAVRTAVRPSGTANPRFFRPGTLALGTPAAANVYPGRGVIVRVNVPFASFGTGTTSDSD